MSSSLVIGGTVASNAAPGSLDDICALSPLQQEIFSDPNHGSYAQQVLWTCRGSFDEETFTQSWELLVRRHPVLRTVFRRARKQPVQIIRNYLPLSLSVYDFSDRPEENQKEALQTLCEKELTAPFSLADGPLFRVIAFRLSRDYFQTLLTFHPILLDHQSVETIHGEVSAIYHVLQNSQVPSEQEAPAIKEFLLWLKKANSSEASQYWRNRLEGAVATHFPADRQDSRDPGESKARILLDCSVNAPANQLARQSGVKVSTVFQAAWALLLGRWCATNDVIYGLAVDGRPKSLDDVEQIAGRFARVLPLRVHLQAEQSVSDFLRSVEQRAGELENFGHFPLPEIRDADGTPLSRKPFNSTYIERFITAGSKPPDKLQFLGGRTGSQDDGPTLEVVFGEELQVALVYPEQRFESTTMQALAAAFQCLVHNMAANAEGLAVDLDMISDGERECILGLSQGDVLRDEKLWSEFNIKKPDSCTGVYVIDEKSRLLPIGCFGQIAVGVAVASEPSSTDGQSAPKPFVLDQSCKLQLTGERGRWTKDGRLEISAKPETQVAEGIKAAEYIAPRTEIEQTVAEVWKEVLKVPRVGVKDDFFDLGGHSLNTIQIRSRLSQRLGINVPLKMIFANQVLEAQAQALAALKPGPARAAQGIPRLPQRKHYPVSHAQKRLWFLHRLDPDNHFYHTADYIQLDGPLDRAAFEQAFHALVERQEILRTSFRLIADEPVQCISEHTLDIRFDDLSHLGEDAQAERLRQLQQEVPHWLSNLEEPPVGALLIKLAHDKHVFILAIHHILSDEWSGQVVWRDLMELYSAACRKQAPQLSPIRVRYADFAVWQKERIESGKLAESERYWMTRLSGPLPKLKLFHARPQDQQGAVDVFMETAESGPELTAQLIRLGQAEEATPFMVKLAVLKAFLARVTGQDDVLLGSTTAGRDHPEIEPLVGLFVNVVALRTSLAGDPKLTDVLKRVKQTCIEAYSHQEYPFDLLVQKLAPSRDGRQLPLLEVFFADLPQLEPQVIEGLRFTAMDISQGMSVGIAGSKLPVPMGMICHETGGGNLTWRFLFRPDSIDRETPRRFARQFSAFLSSLAERPEEPLSAINIVPGAGKQVVLQRLAGREEYPLSFNQRDMWFQKQIHTEVGLNHLGAMISLSGPLNQELFRQAIQAVVDRHDTMRTVFIERNGVPFQRVLAAVPVVLPMLDLSGKNEEEQSDILQQRKKELIGAAYDFSSGPLFRLEVLRLGNNKHALIFAFSHLILDGVYMADFFNQAATAYEMLLQGQPAALPPLEVQYGDFATWQDERLAQGLLEQHQNYWQEQLQPPLPAMSLPSDNDTRSVQSFAVGFTQWQVRDEVFQRLKTFRKRYRTTMFRTVLAAFEVLLRKVIGEKELLLGIPFSSLPAHVSQVLGFFGHAVPVRVHVDDEQPFTAVLNDVNREIGRAQEHLEYPLCEAVRGLQINRDPHRPLFPVVVSQVKALDRTVGELRLRMDLRPVHAGVYHLWLTILESKEGLYLGFYYNREVLQGRPLEMIQGCLNEILAQVAATPDAPIANLGIVSTAEQEMLLKELAGGVSSPAETGSGIIARIEHFAQQRPHATAASCGNDQLTYEQLNQAANRMARWLRAQGIGQESRIGIFGNRGLEMLTTLLAVLKAGAAFVPLDPEHPDARLNGMMERAGITILATSAALVGRSQALAAGIPRPPQVLSWHELSNESAVPNPTFWADLSASNLEFRNGLDDLAYVCHTSGSTGMPKGAMVEHRGMLNHLLAKIGFLELNQDSVVAQNASHCFDISIWQFFAALVAGGRVVIYPPESLFLKGSLLQKAAQDEITVLEIVPSLLEMMLNEVPPEVKLERLRHLISNAELLPVPLFHRWKKKFPHVAVVNAYGATECSDDSTHHIIGAVSERTVRIPLGKSIPGAQHYVLDDDLRPVPAGCAGQIAVGGEAVGRGYLGNPVATARAFVPDPFRGEGRRLYLTGDLGRWNSAGELEFLGRKDSQIKIHGHRVELGEIEAALGKLTGVRQTAVIVSDEEQGQRLLAYWVGEAGVDTAQLRDHARKELPPYMVPNAFIQMTALPLNSNGKVDRRELPKPDAAESDGFVPPRDEVEFKLAKLWCAELDISSVGVFDNFFERGGHSLKAVSLINRLQTEFKINLPLRTVFDHQTIDSLSRVIRERCQESKEPRQTLGGLVSLQSGKNSNSLPLFIVHPHGGTVFCYQALAAALGNEAPIFGIQCRGLEEGEQPLASIPEMAEAYIKDVLQVQPQGPYQVAGWSLGGPIVFEMARQLEAGGHKVAFLGVFDSAIPSTSGKSPEQLLPGFAGMKDLGPEINMAQFARWFFQADERQFENLSDSQIMDAIREMAQQAGMLPPEVSPAMLKRFVAVAIASGLAFIQYQPAGPVTADVVLFRAAQSLVEDPQWWAPWTRGQVQTVPVEGSHYDMVFPPAVHGLAAALKKYLQAASTARG